jgi:hypothetical protein
MMRSSNYARTSPETRQGFAVLVVRLVRVIMAREHMGALTSVNGFWTENRLQRG